jgi:NAD+ diphosphatase
MKLAETVTFGGSGLDRAAHLRGDPVALETALLNPDARAILFWRDKPMLAGAACDQLARLPLDHLILQQAGPLRVSGSKPATPSQPASGLSVL